MCVCFFLKVTATTENYTSGHTLSLHDALPISPAWPLPKVFRLTKSGKLTEGIFKGETINTPSMLAVEDAIFALEWGKSVGGLHGLIKRSDANADRKSTRMNSSH